MQSRLKFIVMFLTIAVLGCATEPSRTTEKDRAITSAIIVPLLDEEVPVIPPAWNVFAVQPLMLKLNAGIAESAGRHVSDRIKSARPTWDVRVESSLAAEVLQRTRRMKFASFDDQSAYMVRSTLALATPKAGQAVFILHTRPTQDLGIPTGQGLQIALIGRTVVQSYMVVHMSTDLKTVDAARGTQNCCYASSLETSNLKIGSNVDSVRSPEAMAAISDALRAQMRKALDNVMSTLGY